MSPCTSSVLVPVPGLLRLTAALFVLLEPQASAAAAAARVRMRFISILLRKMRVVNRFRTLFRIGPLFGKAWPRHVIGGAPTWAADDVLRRAGLCAGRRGGYLSPRGRGGTGRRSGLKIRGGSSPS